MRYILFLSIISVLTVAGGCASTGIDGKTASYHYQMGLSYLEERNYTAALIELSEAEKANPGDAELQYQLGRALVGKRRLDLAEQRFMRALVLRPNYSEVRNDLGVVYLELGRWDSAIQQFKIVKNDLFYPYQDHAVINLGLGYLGKGDYTNALKELDNLKATAPRNPLLRVAIGRVYFAQNQLERATDEFQTALDIAPEYAAAHFHLGLTLMKQKKYAAAAASFETVVRTSPDSENGRNAQHYLELLKQ